MILYLVVWSYEVYVISIVVMKMENDGSFQHKNREPLLSDDEYSIFWMRNEM